MNAGKTQRGLDPQRVVSRKAAKGGKDAKSRTYSSFRLCPLFVFA
jgi:hypothetical protein